MAGWGLLGMSEFVFEPENKCDYFKLYLFAGVWNTKNGSYVSEASMISRLLWNIETSGLCVGSIFRNIIFRPFKICSYQTKPRLFVAEPTFADRHTIFWWAGMAKSPKMDPSRAVYPPGWGNRYSLCATLGFGMRTLSPQGCSNSSLLCIWSLSAVGEGSSWDPRVCWVTSAALSAVKGRHPSKMKESM